jgi:hypothetical protein
VLNDLSGDVSSDYLVGAEVNRSLGMINGSYATQYNPAYYSQYFPNMASFIDENILVGDKSEGDRLIASYWEDLGDDIFDNWGFFYLYDVSSGKYYFPIISPRNRRDGLMSLQTFNVFGRTFTITHGWAAQGIFKFDISVNDNLPFKFGGYGNMGFDNNGDNTDLTYNYTLVSNNMTLYYIKQEQSGSNTEIIYSYFVPKNVSENATITYDFYRDLGSDDTSLMSKEITNGLLVYFAKTNDTKEWIINDIITTLD